VYSARINRPKRGSFRCAPSFVAGTQRYAAGLKTIGCAFGIENSMRRFRRQRFLRPERRYSRVASSDTSTWMFDNYCYPARNPGSVIRNVFLRLREVTGWQTPRTAKPSEDNSLLSPAHCPIDRHRCRGETDARIQKTPNPRQPRRCITLLQAILREASPPKTAPEQFPGKNNLASR